MSQDHELTNLLKVDPIEIAEKLRDQSGYKADFDAIALLLHMGKVQRVNAALEQRDDTKLTNELDRYTRIIEELGFVKVLDTPFTGRTWNDDEQPPEEHQMVYAHTDGMLLVFDTYHGTRVNSGQVYYAHKPKDLESRNVYSSGGFETISGNWPENWRERDLNDVYWFGDHDAREALRHNIANLREAGQFMNPWPAPTNGSRWLWMCHYMDLDNLKYGDPLYQQRIDNARKRLDLLPDWVKAMINIDTLTA